MADRYPSLGAIVVNYNAGPVLLDCIHALLESAVEATITVVDNASSDRSVEAVEAEFAGHEFVHCTRNSENIGFARAVNQAAGLLDTEYLLILNPDCVLRGHALERLVDALDADASAGLAGPMVRDGQGEMETACFRRFPRPRESLMTATGLWRLGRWISPLRGVQVPPPDSTDRVMEAEATSGSCMLVRRAAFTEIGCLDEDYELHFEDLDLMYRLQEAGWRCLFVPAALAEHLKGVSSGSRPTWVHWQKHRGMIRFYRKCLAQEYAWPIEGMVVLGTWLHFLLLLPFVWLRR